jgi:hypothetical protein
MIEFEAAMILFEKERLHLQRKVPHFFFKFGNLTPPPPIMRASHSTFDIIGKLSMKWCACLLFGNFLSNKAKVNEFMMISISKN